MTYAYLPGIKQKPAFRFISRW